MRAWIPLAALLAGACSYPEDKFVADREAKYCETLESDMCGNVQCPDNPGTTTGGATTTVPDGCQYDAKKAKDCIKADWTCTNIGGVLFPTEAEVCAEVYVCSGTPS